MWKTGTVQKPTKEIALARAIKRGPPTVSAPRIALPNDVCPGNYFLPPTFPCNGCWFTAWCGRKSKVLVFVVFVRNRASRRPSIPHEQDA